MVRLTLPLLVLLLGGCLGVDKSNGTAEAEAWPSECRPSPIVMAENLTALTYSVSDGGGSGGSASAYHFQVRDITNLVAIEIRAEWEDGPLYLEEIALGVNVFEGTRIPTIQGPSPLEGRIDMPSDVPRQDDPYVSLRAPADSTPGANVALVDQPVRLTIQEVYC